MKRKSRKFRSDFERVEQSTAHRSHVRMLHVQQCNPISSAAWLDSLMLYLKASTRWGNLNA